MGERKPPLRAAFWAISAALLLMLLATLSDPHRVRQSLIDSRGRDRVVTARRAESPVEIANGDRMPIRQPMPDELPSELPAGLATARNAASPAPADQTARRTMSGGARTQVVATNGGEDQRIFTRAVVRPSMPILSPGALTGPNSDARFEELPPPPGAGADEESHLPAPLGQEAFVTDDEIEPAFERLQLENELLSLRHELTLSVESRQSEQIQALQHQQTSLLERQQQTANRLDRLTQQIAAQSARLERLCLEMEESSATGPREAAGRGGGTARRGSYQDPIGDSRTAPPDHPRLEPPASGRHRVSVVIESDDAAGIFERLTRWPSRTASDSGSQPITRSTFIEPRQRYLAPPPGHADPTPLTDLDPPPVPALREARVPQTPLGAPHLPAPPARH